MMLSVLTCMLNLKLNKEDNVMKKLYFFLLAICLIGNGCDKNKSNHAENIIGKWKLIEVEIFRIYYQPYEYQSEIIDYSNDNIIFDFQENNKLVITGQIVDTLSLFDDFKEEEHFYEYKRWETGNNYIPGPNLFIDKPALGEANGCYFCNVPLDKQTMSIVGDRYISVTDTDHFRLSITLKNLK